MKTKNRFDIVGAHGCAPLGEIKMDVYFNSQCKGGQPSAPTENQKWMFVLLDKMVE